MSVVVSEDGKIWLRCEDPECPSLEHPEDLHSHQIFAGVPLADVKAMVVAELQRRHLGHGAGTAESGPDDPDCGCRGTRRQRACASAGCGFCRCAK